MIFQRLFGRKPKLPVFIISYNRGALLERVVKSYERQSVDVDIIVHDNGSDDPATLRVLECLEKSGARVYRRAKIESPDALNRVDETVQAVFADRKPSAYVVTDCDIDLTTADRRAIAVYLDLLDKFADAECVGPMLKIADIRKSYPLFGRVMNLHIQQFWHRDPEWTSIAGKNTAFIRAPIDTTFAVHRAGEHFRRLKSGIRVYHPFEARHLDWYVEDTAATSATYRDQSSEAIAHWNNRAYFADHIAEKPRFEDFVVVIEQDSQLRAVRRRVDDNPL